jgi:zinc/manganese transport system permease protein
MPEAALFQGLSWNLVDDVQQLTTFPFMVHALAAGTIVAVTAGVIGWFVVLRRQVFAAHTLGIIAFPGAAIAVYVGLPLAAGYFGACAAGALALAAVAGTTRSHSSESAAIGTLQAAALAAGFLFVSLSHSVLNGLDALLFGQILGITSIQVWTLLAVSAAALVVTGLAARPLLFASLDADIAAARGVPVRLLGGGFLLVLGLAVAETSQITGALLVFALLVMPAATVQLVTSRPLLGLALSVLLALLVTWLGLALAYFSIYPVGFYVTSLAFGLYLLARLGRALRH